MIKERQNVVGSVAPSGNAPNLSSKGPGPGVVIVWSRTIPLDALCERLGLLFELGLPCTLHHFPNAPRPHRMPINRCGRQDDGLVLSGDHRSVHLCAEGLQAVCVMTLSRNGRSRKVVELRDKSGALHARIFGLRCDRETDVWNDIMDTFILPMGNAGENEPHVAPAPPAPSPDQWCDI